MTKEFTRGDIVTDKNVIGIVSKVRPDKFSLDGMWLTVRMFLDGFFGWGKWPASSATKIERPKKPGKG